MESNDSVLEHETPVAIRFALGYLCLQATEFRQTMLSTSSSSQMTMLHPIYDWTRTVLGFLLVCLRHSGTADMRTRCIVEILLERMLLDGFVPTVVDDNRCIQLVSSVLHQIAKYTVPGKLNEHEDPKERPKDMYQVVDQLFMCRTRLSTNPSDHCSYDEKTYLRLIARQEDEARLARYGPCIKDFLINREDRLLLQPATGSIRRVLCADVNDDVKHEELLSPGLTALKLQDQLRQFTVAREEKTSSECLQKCYVFTIMKQLIAALIDIEVQFKPIAVTISVLAVDTKTIEQRLQSMRVLLSSSFQYLCIQTKDATTKEKPSIVWIVECYRIYMKTLFSLPAAAEHLGKSARRSYQILQSIIENKHDNNNNNSYIHKCIETIILQLQSLEIACCSHASLEFFRKLPPPFS